MAIVPLFDATKWIPANLIGGTKISMDTMGAFSSFSRMWLLFESVLCHGNTDAQVFVRVAESISQARTSAPTLATLKDHAVFWTDRCPGSKDLCAKHLRSIQATGGNVADSVVVMALILMFSVQIVQRSLFLGVKSVDSINEQLENLDVASQSLAILLLMAGPQVVLPTKGRRAGSKRRALRPVGGE